MKFEHLKPGMIVYDVHKHKMGNTTISTWGVWMVRIITVYPESKSVDASWNCNETRRYFSNSIKKWKERKPGMVKSGFGERPATRAELKAMKEKPNE